MAPRHPKRTGIDNLTARMKNGKMYYAYKHPETGKEVALGTDKAKAVEAAKAANAMFAKMGNLTAKIISGGKTFGDYLTHWKDKILPTKMVKGQPLSTETVTEYKRVVRALDAALGLYPLATLGQGHIADYLNTLGSAEVYNKHRALLLQICRYAVSDAKLTHNPVEKILPRDKVRRKRQRLILEWYSAIYAKAAPVVQHGMELALNITQRNYDLRVIRFTDHREDEKKRLYLFLIQSKTRKHGKSAYLKIPGDLPTVHSEAGHKTLTDLINACRDDVLSPFVLHEMPERKRKSKEKEHWTQISKKRLSRGFAEARDLTGLFDDMPEEQRPTFYECVSLGTHLREKAGWTKAQIKKIKGHTRESTTDIYLDGHDYTTIEE